MKNGSMNKPIIIALLLVAFLTMLLGWVGLSGDVKDELKDEYGDEAYEAAYDQLSESLESELSYGMLDSELGNTKIAKDAKAVLRTVKDLKLTPGELGAAASGIISISNTINHYLEKASEKYGYDYDNDYVDSELEGLLEIGFGIKFGVIVYRIVFYLAMLSILLAAIRVIASSKDLGYIPLILSGLIFVTMTAGVIYLNSTAYESTEMNILALRLWPFITLLSLLAARLLSSTLAGAGQEMAFAGLKNEVIASSAILKDKGEKVLDSLKSGASNLAQSATNSGPWTCPDCQHDCLPAANFCPICGKIKPEPRKCFNCASILPDDSVFCQKCGTKYEKTTFCGLCGKKLINEEKCDCQSTIMSEQASSEQTL